MDVVWRHSGDRGSFQIDRRSNSGRYVTIATSSTTSFSDTSPAAGTAHLYRVRAVKAGVLSNPSAPDLATTVIFTDVPLAAGETLITGRHLDDLRVAVNAVRATAGLTQAAFTDSPLAGYQLKTLHVQEIRDALDQGRSALLIPALTYTDQPLAAGTVCKAVHIEQIREGVK